MSTPPKMTLRTALLVALAACVRPAYSGSAAAGEALPAPAATTGTVRPSAGVSAAAPAAIRTSAPQALVRLQNVLATDPRAAVPVLVIPAKEIDAQAFDRIVEDLTIMSRIIEKGLRNATEESYALAMAADPLTGQNIFFRFDSAGPRILRSSDGRPRPMYVGGYGAVFSLQVAFPLVPPPEAPEPNKAADEPDRTWTQARRELLDPQAARRTPHGAPQEKAYSAEAVESLRTTLIRLLRHAANIRDLEPDSWLTILVQGPGPAAEDRAQNPPVRQPANLTGVPATDRTSLTLRARKADIDQHAKGQLDEAQFQQRVQITAY